MFRERILELLEQPEYKELRDLLDRAKGLTTKERNELFKEWIKNRPNMDKNSD